MSKKGGPAMSKSKMYEIDGDYIKKLIKKGGMTETALAKKTGYTLRRINDALCSCRISISMLDEIAKALDLRPDILLSGNMPELTGNDPISKQLHKDLISYNSHYNLDSRNDIEFCIKKLCLGLGGLDYGFVKNLSDEDIEDLKKRIGNAINNFHFLRSIIWE